MKTEINDNGKVTVTVAPSEGGVRQWECRNPDQASKHIPTWQAEGMPSGDRSAIMDCHRDWAKQRREGALKPTQKWVYVNGEAVPVIIDGTKVKP